MISSTPFSSADSFPENATTLANHLAFWHKDDFLATDPKNWASRVGGLNIVSVNDLAKDTDGVNGAANTSNSISITGTMPIMPDKGVMYAVGLPNTGGQALQFILGTVNDNRVACNGIIHDDVNNKHVAGTLVTFATDTFHAVLTRFDCGGNASRMAISDGIADHDAAAGTPTGTLASFDGQQLTQTVGAATLTTYLTPSRILLAGLVALTVLPSDAELLMWAKWMADNRRVWPGLLVL